jgi:pimeloyl-ACP methyl ester carboxylesterase
MILPAALVVMSGILVVFGLLVYRLTHPAAAPEDVTPSHFLMPSRDVVVTSRNGTEFPAWWIPGSRTCPAIVLAPGYGMSRAHTLSLASALRQKGFCVLAVDLRGGGAAPAGASSLGLMEASDLLSAIDFVRGQPGVDSGRLGMWGVDVGARAALGAAAARPEVRAIAIDSVFESVVDFIEIRLAEDLGPVGRFMNLGCVLLFRAYAWAMGVFGEQSLLVEALADRSVLFIQGENRRELARHTQELYDRLKPRKEMISVSRSRSRHMSGEEMRSYDRQVSNFFQLNLSARTRAPERAVRAGEGKASTR